MTRSDLPHGGVTVYGDEYVTWDAAYVLGSLSSADRREYEAHLQGCSRCRSAVAEVSGIPALLARLEPDDVLALDEEIEPPPMRPELLQSVLDKVRRRRRRARWLTTAAVGVAAAVLAIGVVVAIRPDIIGLPSEPPQAGGQMVEMTEVSATPISASVSMTGYAWGTRIDMACSYGDWGNRDAAPQNLGMVVVGHDGSHSEVATWLGLSGATALPSGNTPMQPDEIAAVQVVSSDSGEVLLEARL